MCGGGGSQSYFNFTEGDGTTSASTSVIEQGSVDLTPSGVTWNYSGAATTGWVYKATSSNATALLSVPTDFYYNLTYSNGTSSSYHLQTIGSNVYDNGSLIGNITGNGTASLAISFGTFASTQDAMSIVGAFADRTSYSNTSDRPPASDVVTLRLGGNTLQTTVSIIPVNDAPRFVQPVSPVSYVARDPGAQVASVASVVDPDNDTFQNGTLSAVLSGGAMPGDRLALATSPVAGQGVTIEGDGVSVDLNGVKIGTLTTQTPSSLVVSLNGNAGAGAVDALAEAVRFSSDADIPTPGTRTIAFTLVDGSGTAYGGSDTGGFNQAVIVTNRPAVVWTAGVTGDWSNAADWVGGVAPTAADDVVVPGATTYGGTAVTVTGAQRADSLSVDSSTAGQYATASVEVAGGLTLSGALALTSNAGAFSDVGLADGAVLTAGGGISIDGDSQLYTWDNLSGGTTTATVNAAVVNDGQIVVGQNSALTLNGAVTGTGDISFNGVGTLALNGASDETIQFSDGATLDLGQSAAFTGALDLAGTDSLNLEGGAFGGRLDFFGTGITLDLLGVSTASVAASGSRLHLTEAGGQTLDLTAYVFPNGYPGTFDPATYQLPVGYVPLATSDGHGGTLISFVPTTQTWIAGAEGNWEDPNNWTAGRIPDSFANVVFSGDNPAAGIVSDATIGEPETIASLNEDFSQAGQFGTVHIESSLTVAGNVTLTSASNFTQSGQGAGIELDAGAALTAGGLIDIGHDSFIRTVVRNGTVGTATINGAIQDDGLILLDRNTDFVINGNVTGGGAFEFVDAGATLELNGASNVTVDFSLEGASTLKLDQAASVTSQLVIYSGSSATLDLSGANSFGGTLDFNHLGGTLDLTGVATQSFTFSGSHLHIVETNGQTLDLTAYLSSLGYAIVPATYQLPAGYGLNATSDGHGGTLLSFVKGATPTWIGGSEGDWSQAGNWQSGTVPDPADTIVTPNGPNLIDVTTAVQTGSLEDKGAGVKVMGGALTLAGALTVDANSQFQFQDGGSLTAASVTIARYGTLLSSVDHIGQPSGVVNSDVQNNGTIEVNSNSGLVIDGALTGSGFVRLNYGSTLELGGADTQDIYLQNSNTLVLDDASDVSGSIVVRGAETLDLKGSTGFGGTLKILGIGTLLDLIGVTAASLSGTDLHVTTAGGQALDLTTLLAPDGVLSDVTSAGPTYALVTKSDGNFGTLVSFQSVVEHAPTAGTTLVTNDLEDPQSLFTVSLSGSDQDYDPLSVVSVQAAGSSTPTSIDPTATLGQLTDIQGLYGTLALDGNSGKAYYFANAGAASGVVGQHPIDAFQYTLSDGRGGTATGTLDVSINRGPTANNDSATVTGSTLSADAAHGVLANDTDPDGDALQVVGVGPAGIPSNSPSQEVVGNYGNLVINADGSYVYTVTNAPTVAGAHDVFSYTVSDEPLYAQNAFNLPQATLDISVPLAPPPTTTTTTILPDGSTKVSTYTNGTLVEAKVTGITGQAYTGKDTLYAGNGKPTTITFTRADASVYATLSYAPDGTYSVAHPGMTGQVYTSYTDVYSAAGTLTQALFQGVTGQPYTAYTKAYTPNGTVTATTYSGVTGQPYTSYTDHYGAGGTLASIGYTKADGSTYAVLTYAADGSHSVAHPGVTGQAYTTLTNLYAADGTLTGTTYDGITGQPYTSYTNHYGAGGTLAAIGYTKADGSPYAVLTYAADGSHSVAHPGVTGQAYTSLTNVYAANGTLLGSSAGGYTAASYDTADTAYAANGKPVFEAFTQAGVITKTETFTAGGAPGTVVDYAAAGTGGVTNAGLFEKLGTADTWLVDALLNNSGTIDVESGALQLNQGGANTGTISVGSGAQITSLGWLTGGGEVDLQGAGMVDLKAGSTNSFVYTDSSAATLRLDDAADFGGQIKGFSAKSAIDLGGFDTASTFVYTPNPAQTGGVLSINDGALHADLAFVGAYAASDFAPLTQDKTKTGILIQHA